MPDKCMNCGKLLKREPPNYVSVTLVQGQTALTLGADWFLFDSLQCLTDFANEAVRVGYFVRKDIQEDMKKGK